jgi:hypothetical protein
MVTEMNEIECAGAGVNRGSFNIEFPWTLTPASVTTAGSLMEHTQVPDMILAESLRAEAIPQVPECSVFTTRYGNQNT